MPLFATNNGLEKERLFYLLQKSYSLFSVSSPAVKEGSDDK